MQYIKLVILLLIPFNSEKLLTITERNSNIALYGIHLEIYYKRNLLYISSILFAICYLLKYAYYGLTFFLLSLLLFLNSCNKWKVVLLNNLY